ncbi:hypothetical protein AVEN_167812-1 [Araneus ventricosus]|uniref:Uncharacterized protein n=1 Tax=Araneus ventricosus TaxID=182803 RepID=A0A4Y2KK92_ARAVE|nr:hypothetical protein AVEN_155904-1 [Araneus ventricosus]GBN02013.1 hypothetical protein AVEN_167812-1 [Araneus ventricosus]
MTPKGIANVFADSDGFLGIVSALCVKSFLPRPPRYRCPSATVLLFTTNIKRDGTLFLMGTLLAGRKPYSILSGLPNVSHCRQHKDIYNLEGKRTFNLVHPFTYNDGSLKNIFSKQCFLKLYKRHSYNNESIYSKFSANNKNDKIGKKPLNWI